jgi:hypothetical protein
MLLKELQPLDVYFSLKNTLSLQFFLGLMYNMQVCILQRESVADPGIFQSGGPLLFWVFKGRFHSQNALFLPYFVKFSDKRGGGGWPPEPPLWICQWEYCFQLLKGIMAQGHKDLWEYHVPFGVLYFWQHFYILLFSLIFRHHWYAIILLSCNLCACI